jgi:hypothetical protein
MASLTALAGTLASTLATTLISAALPPPPPPPAATVPARTPTAPDRVAPRGGGPAAWRLEGAELRINGQSQRARWLWLGAAAPPEGGGDQLWLPLEVLQDQLGVSSRTLPDGTLDLEWFGRGLRVPPAAQRSLEDEVAVEVAGLLRSLGVGVAAQGSRLDLTLPMPRLLQVRSADQPGLRRVVLDLAGPALVRSGSGLVLALLSDTSQRDQLRQLGLPGRVEADGLRLAGGVTPRRVFSLGTPARLVLELPAATGGATATGVREPEVPIDPRLVALLGRQVEWQRQVQTVAGERVRLSSVRIDPTSAPLALRPLSRPDGMQGLSQLTGLARQQDALVAINGGYFNRVRRLPLGALRSEGRWLSGPILNRGVVAWEPRSLPRFGRLQLEEWLTDGTGRRWPLNSVNSGFVERGLSRYNADWGPRYTALSGREQALLLRDGLVAASYGQQELVAGVPLRAGDLLVVARAGAELPEANAGALRLESRPSSTLGQASYVVGGGPLLLQEGRNVLDGVREGFSPAFLSQGAPRTVIGSDGRRLWLVTLEGIDGNGPTLAETAWLLQGLGLRDALNLDGGSSTGLVLGGRHTVKGRGVAAAVHHGLGLVPEGRDGGGS